MIIQCEQCSTKFRLDDAKIKDTGVKVRCAKCRHVFTVTKQQQELESQPDAVAGFEQPAVPSEPPFAAQAAGDGFAFAPPAVEPSMASTKREDSGFSFSDDAEYAAVAHDETVPPSSELDFSDFDFRSAAVEKGGITASDTADFSEGSPHPDTPDAHDAHDAHDAEGFDFGDGSLFGDAVSPAHEESTGPISFDFPAEAFADSMGTAEKTPAGKGGGGIDAVKVDEPFSLGEIDFGDELTSVAVQQVNPEELKPAQELFFAPLAEAQEKKEGTAGEGVVVTPSSSAPQEELPPLSIASRRKQSPIFMGLVVVLAMLVVAVVGYVGYSMFGVEKVAKESGRITVRGVNAAFVKNSVAGELVVISGEAVNEFAGPRAAIQVKGMIYGPGGQVLASKSAFCGNPLTMDQLASMPLDKIEAAMANQFGDSLDNLEVPPGKSIPFVIVIAGPPANAKDYGVEPAGSTVATEKQPQS